MIKESFACGPKATLLDRSRREQKVSDPILEAAALLKKGRILAVKGIGGYHLMCDAVNDRAVGLLRLRLKREFKPFALIAKDLKTAALYCQINQTEKKLLESLEHPIVLLSKKNAAKILRRIAPDNNFLGIMLPLTPLHILLFAQGGLEMLAAASANLSDEPVIYEENELFEKLGTVADYFLVHNQPIRDRCDDSILTVVEKEPIMLRRGRGFAPLPIKLKKKTKPVLGCGAETNNTFCFLRDDQAYVSQYIGDLKNYEVYEYYQEAMEHYAKLFKFNPEILAYDLNPAYLSTEFALSQPDVRLIGVAHQHAHIAACMAENKIEEKVIGVALDGVGYGTDGRIWGFEFLCCDLRGFDRLAQLKYCPLPGADVAGRVPLRMAISYLYQIFGQEIFKLKLPLFKNITGEEIESVLAMIGQDIYSMQSSSCGLLFDAVAALLGIRSAMELEMAAKSCRGHYPYKIKKEGAVWIINPLPLISAIVDDFELLEEGPKIAFKFHSTLVKIVIEVCEKIREETKLNAVALSGEFFQNRILTANIPSALVRKRFKVYTHKQLPPNDGGISLGQAVVASNVSTHLPTMPGVDLWYIKPSAFT